MLSVAAIIAPLYASGLMYCSSAARSLYGMSKMVIVNAGIYSKSLLHKETRFFAILLQDFFIGLLLFFPLPVIKW